MEANQRTIVLSAHPVWRSDRWAPEIGPVHYWCQHTAILICRATSTAAGRGNRKLCAELLVPSPIVTFPQLVSLVNWCSKPSQPQRITSGPRETFIKRYTIERTNKAEKDRKNRVKKRRVVVRIYGMKYS